MSHYFWFFTEFSGELMEFFAFNICGGEAQFKSALLLARGRCWLKARRVPAKARYYEHPCGSL